MSDDKVYLADGRTVVPRVAVDALTRFDVEVWPGATFAGARPAVVAAVIEALEGDGYVLTKAVEPGCPPDWQTEWVSLSEGRCFVAMRLPPDDDPEMFTAAEARMLASDLVIAAQMVEQGRT